MNPAQFVSKWSKVELTERSAAQQHFLDLCDLVGHPKPAEADPTGERFTFERGAEKHGGGDGWADVWKRDFFGWEYKGRKKDLKAAYDQLLKYRESLENPPLLVVCDMDRIEVHTNFTATAKRVYEIPLAELDRPESLAVLREVFFEPAKLRPGVTSEAITQVAARHVGEIAQTMTGRGLEPHAVAHFLDRLVFCLFAEDVELLPKGIFTRLVENAKGSPDTFSRMVGQLFEAMAVGSSFGPEPIRHFNGNLFTGGEVLPLTPKEITDIRDAARLDWGAVDPSIFGTLFERGLDPAKRSQLGAHYTSRQDIETLVEPVVMQPLRREWAAVREQVEKTLAGGKRGARQDAEKLLHGFMDRLGHVRVLDPACGSGNFLYVTLQKLKDLEKEAYVYLLDQGFTGRFLTVHPSQLYGIEINLYAFDLAQMTVWIGYLQWLRANGFPAVEEPILKPMEGNFLNMDAILDLTDPEHPREPEWPSVDFIVGNPPFLGDKKMRTELGHGYVETLRELYAGRVPGGADLVTYWFERARQMVVEGRAERAGLLATNSIRQAGNRRVLERLKETGDIFWAWSDRPWTLEGAAVRVSMVGFDRGQETQRELDGKAVGQISTGLTASADLTTASVLPSNRSVGFVGDCKKGSFDLEDDDALRMLCQSGNPNRRPNSDVLVPLVNAADVTGRIRHAWIVDFGVAMPEREAALYEVPFEYVRLHVKPEREAVRNPLERSRWWLHARPAPDMRAAASKGPRYLAVPGVSKHRVFVWLQWPVLPAHRLVVFGRSDDLFFGILQSKLHQLWSLRMGSTLEDRPCYTPTTCFETFPLPRPRSEQRDVIAAAGKDLETLRANWLNPPEWTREEELEFPGAVDGPWARYVHDPDPRGIGTVRYPRIVPKDEESAKLLQKRTLTNLYNERPTWLDLAHRKLDEAVFAAYGWAPGLSDEEILEKLLALNLERAAAEGKPTPAPSS